MLGRVPKVTEQLLGNIPRLEPVREILELHTRRYKDESAADANSDGPELPWGARALKIAIDYDILESQGMKSQEALEVLRQRSGWYDTNILEILAELKGRRKPALQVRKLRLQDMSAGMIFGEDVKSAKGLLLIARGQEVTSSLLERIRNFSSELGIPEPIRMIDGRAASTVTDAVPVGS